MARTRKTDKHNDTEEQAKLVTVPSFIVTQKLRGSINGKEYSHEVGEKIQFNQFEASVFKNFIKEE